MCIRDRIIVLDREPVSEYIKQLPKITYLQHDMADDTWQDKVSKHEPDVVIHLAWQIRSIYGGKKKQWQTNVGGSNKVFSFAFNQPSAKQLVHFSTAASYSARKENSFDYYFSEEEPLRDDNYRYALELSLIHISEPTRPY